MATRIGDLRERVELQERTTTRDEYGAKVEAYETRATLWANVRTVAGGESEEGTDQVIADLTHVVTVRYRTVAPTTRVIWRGRELDVLDAIETDNRRAFLQLRCREVVD